MPWTKLDDGFYDNPKILAAGNELTGIYVRSLSYCARHLTDGHLADPAALTFASKRNIERMVEVGLWERNGSGYLIPDYLEFNPSAEQIKNERRSARERMAKKR